MRNVFKIISYAVIVVVLLLIIVLTYIKTMLPSVGDSPDLKVEMSMENIERGSYLAHHVMVCMDCHSTRDWSLFAGPPIAGTEGKGGEVFDQTLGFPGKYVSNNITPYHLGNWTDGEIFRAITTGVSKDGRALFPVMPYHNFGQMDQSDIEAIIAYIRTLRPIENETEKSSSDFPINFIINTMPKKASFKTIPSKTDVIQYGKYMVTASGCADCHTNQVKGKVVGEPFAGGFEFKFPDGSVLHSANITPDKLTGIGKWTKEEFINRFKFYADSAYTPEIVKSGSFQTLMPWIMYAGMTTEDLSAMYEYIHSLKPVENEVIKFTPSK
jgi:mono/diheme cytochrome c family protein